MHKAVQIYVADLHRLTHTAGFQEPGLHDPEVQKSYYYVDTGLIAGNVYVFAAAEGLAAWFHNCNKTGLTQKLGLRAEQRVAVRSVDRVSRDGMTSGTETFAHTEESFDGLLSRLLPGMIERSLAKTLAKHIQMLTAESLRRNRQT